MPLVKDIQHWSMKLKNAPSISDQYPVVPRVLLVDLAKVILTSN